MLGKARQLYEFGPFRIDPDRRQLLRQSQPVPLQPKSFDILLVLVENSEKVVSKDELLKMVWPDTFVEESNLAQCIFILRKTLGDTIEEKRYIVTVPGRGYRFAGTVRVIGEEQLSAPEEDMLVVERHTRSQMVIQPSVLADRVLPQVQGRRRIRPAVFVLCFAMVVAVIAAVVFRPFVPGPRVVRIRQLTHLGSLVYNSLLVTDGPRIYFCIREGKHRAFRYVSPEGGEVFPVQTSLPRIDINDISPDGSELLVEDLNSGGKDGRDVWRVPVSGGSPRSLGGIRARDARWSPDGSTIVYTLGSDLYLVNGDGTNSRKLATMPGEPFYPEWSRDGRRIRVSVDDPRALGATLWQVDVANKTVLRLLPDWPVTSNTRAAPWGFDGRYFFFGAQSESTLDLWAMRGPQGTLRRVDPRPVRLTAGPLQFYSPIPSRDGKSLFAVGGQWRGELLRYDRATSQYQPYAKGISADHVAFSRDGQWMAYVEFPARVLVRARVDGGERRQLTFPPMRAFRPQWSPDGTQIAFQAKARLSAPDRIYLVSSSGGTILPATGDGLGRQLCPSWSSTGDSILFSAADERGENDALYRVDLKTKEASLLPGTAGLYWGQISPDGQHVAALTRSHHTLAIYDTLSRQTQPGGPADYPIWSPDGRYVYYSTLNFGGDKAGIYRWQLSRDKIEKVLDAPDFDLDGSWGVWFGLTPDGDPLVLRSMSSIDLYALDVELP